MVTEATWVEKAKATYELTKDKAVKIGGATLVGAGIFASTACGGGSEAAPAGVNNVAAAEAINVGNDAGVVIYGEECNNVQGIYTLGQTLSGSREGYATQDELLANIRMFDGTKGSSTSTKVELSDDQADQLWASYDAARNDLADKGKSYNFSLAHIVAYGEEIPSSNGIDAKLNVENVCASIEKGHGGSPTIG